MGEPVQPVVLDTSAVLAFLQAEPGADVVEEALLRGAMMCAANWAELSQKIIDRGADWEKVTSLLHGYGLKVEPVTEEDAEISVRFWSRNAPLSLGDRLCLATTYRLSAQVLTADKAWGTATPVVQIR